MTPAGANVGYITIRDIVPPDFLKHPQVVLGEYGNGMGKTHSAVEYAVELQRLGVFDRIYIVQYSQKGCENVVRKIERMGGWAIWHIGYEKFCPMQRRYAHLVDMGIPLSYVCFMCPLFRGKSKLAYHHLEAELRNPSKRVVKPRVYRSLAGPKGDVCTHPLVRSLVLDPTFEIEKRLGLKETPIIVLPGQVFLNHALIGRWKRFARRQRKPRKVLLIIDEADTLFFSALRTEIPEINPTQDDYELLRRHSPRTRRLEKLIDLYQDYVRVVKEVVDRRNQVTAGDVERLREIIERAEPLLGSFERRRKEIIMDVVRNKIRTNVFRVAMKLEELTHIENLALALRTAEKTQDGYVMYDYEYGVRLLFDVEYPWRYFWKINLSATFPTEKIVDSNFLSPRAKQLILSARKRTKSYENVYVSTVTIFEAPAGVLNRNAEIPYSVPRILQAIKRAVEFYEKRFGLKPGGVALWFCNSKQLRMFEERLRQYRVKYRKGRRFLVFYYKGIPVFTGYNGSPVSRGIDLHDYDISIVVGPLLRPPRSIGLLDAIDFAKGVAEAIQSAMRIVRAPRPPRPKLVILESHMTTGFYSFFYPEWFRELFARSYVELE